MVRNTMYEILKKLVSFKTISQEKIENKRAIDWIKKEVRKLPVFYKEFNFGGFPSLIITTKKTKKPKLLLAAHLDVVPGPEKMFSPKIEGKKLFGRGVYDMKFAIACYLKLLEDLKDEIKNYDLGIMITCDEEIGGFYGTKKLLEEGFRAKIVFLPDGGRDWNFEIKAKGAWHLKLKSFGKSAHGSRPWEGEGAIEKLIAFLQKLKSYFKKEPCGLKDHWHPTLNIGKIEGGKATNQVSDFAQAFLDIRFTEKKEKKKIEKILRNLLSKFKGMELEEIVLANCYSVDPKNKYLQIFSRIAKEKFNIETSFVSSHGSSDARFLVERKIPVILIRPKGGGHHSEEEWIDLEDLKKYYEVLKEFVKIVAK